MISKRKADLLERGILLLMALIPLIWFRHGAFLASADTLLPQTWADNLELLGPWNRHLGTGTLYIFDGAAFLFNLLPAAVLRLGGSLLLAQMVEFCFWFGLAVFSMNSMMRLLYEGPYPRLARMAATVFYACNFYVAPIWTGFNKPNIVLYAVFPLFLAGYVRLLEGEGRRLSLIICLALFSILASAVGTNTPIVGVAAVALGLTTIVLLIGNIRAGKISLLGKNLLSVVLLIGLMACLHAFWIIPQIWGATTSVSNLPLAAARNQSLAWLEGISRMTSFWNVLRIQGDWSWYSGVGDPYVLYAARYLHSSFWIILSWMIAGLMCVGVCTAGKRKGLFLALLLAGLFLSMGTHPPTGWVFRWAVLHLPGFWMFRSAWFKFMLLTCVAYGFFLGAGAAWACQRFQNYSPRRVGVAVIFLIALYGSPVIAGTMFPMAKDRAHLPPLQFKPPVYATETAGWFRTRPESERIFVLPGTGVDTNSWGYAGFFPYIRYLTDQPFVYAFEPAFQMLSQGAPHPSLPVISNIRQGLNVFRGDLSPRIDRLLALLGVSTILHEGDYRYEQLPQQDSPEQMRSRILRQPAITPLKQFGPWEIYQVPGALPAWFTAKQAAWISGDSRQILQLSRSAWFDRTVLCWDGDIPVSIKESLTQNNFIRRSVYLADSAGDAAAPEQSAGAVSLIFSTEKSCDPENLLRAWPPHIEKNGIRWEWAKGLGWQNNSNPDWRWLVSANDDSIVVWNPHPWPVVILLAGEVQTAGGVPRTLYFFVNDKPITLDKEDLSQTIRVGETVQKMILPRIPLQPGRNALRFSTTEPWIRQPAALTGEPVELSFAFRDIQLGDPVAEAAPELPRAGKYRLIIYPQFNGAVSDRETVYFKNGRTIALNGQPVPCALKQDDFGLRYWESAAVALPKGPLKIEAGPFLGEHYLFEITDQSGPAGGTLGSVKVERESPSSYRASIQLTAPEILVFNESFHPGWTASRITPDGSLSRIKSHFKANGFANGWLLPEGNYTLQVEFEPKRWWDLGQRISLLTAAGLLVVLAGLFLLRRI